MREEQPWQSEGLGENADDLKKVLCAFRKNGVQGLDSQRALTKYIKKISNESLRDMYEVDQVATLQILADCFGIVHAAETYSKWQNDILHKAIDVLIEEKEKAEQEAETNRKGLLKVREASNKEIDRMRKEYETLKCEKEETEEQIKKLQNEITQYKADLYDFYAQAGKVPNHERR